MMKYKITHFLLPILIVGMLGSCRQKTQTEEQNMVNADTISTEIYVDTLVLRPQTFHRQLVCNGKLRAIAKCELSFSEEASSVASMSEMVVGYRRDNSSPGPTTVRLCSM